MPANLGLHREKQCYCSKCVFVKVKVWSERGFWWILFVWVGLSSRETTVGVFQALSTSDDVVEAGHSWSAWLESHVNRATPSLVEKFDGQAQLSSTSGRFQHFIRWSNNPGITQESMMYAFNFTNNRTSQTASTWPPVVPPPTAGQPPSHMDPPSAQQ